MNDYNACQIDYRERCKTRIQRQLDISESRAGLDSRAGGEGGRESKIRLHRSCVRVENATAVRNLFYCFFSVWGRGAWDGQ